MNIQINKNLIVPSTASIEASSASSSNFQQIFSCKVNKLWADFTKTDLTAADQALKAAGGETALACKKEKEAAEKKKEQSFSYHNTLSEQTETSKKYMPDGSILIITSKNGKVVDSYRKKAKTILVPDFEHINKTDAANSSNTKVKMKKVPYRNPFDDL